MEAVDSGNRQSGHFSATQPEQQQRQPEYPQQPYHHSSYSRESLDRSYRDPAAMATATLLTPSTHYPPQTSSYSGYPHHAAGGSISSMISSVEPRKTVDDNDAASRQSLPSISEVISGTKPGYPPAPSLPSPFPPGTRAYPEAERHASPQPLHQAYAPRQDAPSTYSESPRTGYSSRPPLPPVGTDRRASPSSRSDLSSQHRLPDQQNAPEPHLNGVYGHPIPPPLSYQTTPLPPGQMPLPAYPVSPRHSIPSHNPFEPRTSTLSEEFDFGNRTRYDATVNRHFESWNYQDALSRIGTSARTIYNFAEAYSRIALEQHQAHTIPERLPTEREVGDMIGNVEHLKRSLEQVRDVVMASIQNERAREGAKLKSPYDDEHDIPMYADSMKPQYGMTEVKKRRGRAAPPGRCHSCNRIDTPEWRRGPDGARTLCNACGLHYAKLERKRQMEARSIRPKPEETLRP